MITKDELKKLFVSTETYRVERTASTTDKDKFGEAVCAFANDMPDTGKPGYLLIGVREVGQLSGLKATDELLKKFASLRSDGNILPIPTIAVDSFSFPDGDVIVVEVQPSHQPPVRYRGRTWIRIGPRRDIATLDEEIMLAERKARHFSTFDARPCFQSSIADLDLDLFLHDYFPKQSRPKFLRGMTVRWKGSSNLSDCLMGHTAFPQMRRFFSSARTPDTSFQAHTSSMSILADWTRPRRSLTNIRSTDRLCVSFRR